MIIEIYRDHSSEDGRVLIGLVEPPDSIIKDITRLGVDKFIEPFLKGTLMAEKALWLYQIERNQISDSDFIRWLVSKDWKEVKPPDYSINITNL